MPSNVALVTGASSGIGAATAQRLNGLGYVVYGLARRVDRMAGLDRIGVRTLAVDVTDEQAPAAAIEQIIAEQGRIDVLVNNAGYGSYGALEDVPLSEARYQFEVNVFGLARLIQLVLPHMRRQGSGRIINISSIGGKIYEPLGDWYHAAKFAVEGLSDSLRVELRPFGIDVVIIEPGAIRTEWGPSRRRSYARPRRAPRTRSRQPRWPPCWSRSPRWPPRRRSSRTPSPVPPPPGGRGPATWPAGVPGR